ncbi:hypothetical protein ACQP1G_13480 [Nocardia sp. CA-107356]|uniref:hypothetical protein n=1 Tax=Nocardia sp. CA-107356 TaxID=3239972 RepID=UPI003D8BC27D
MTSSGGADLAALADRIADGLRQLAPPGWQRLAAWFAMTVVAESAQLMVDDGSRSIRYQVSDAVWEMVRRHRQLSAGSEYGPWWRLLVRIDADNVEVVPDHGAEEPFPGEQLFAPDAYLADVERYPRARLPVWLAAYIGHGERQSRPPQAAVDGSRAGVQAVAVDGELPELAVLWARWAVLAAAFVAVGSRRGPRIGPSVGIFESAGRSGSTLTLLPGGRAVLSGGVWDAPVLDAVYNGSGAMPKLFAGAPDWVADPVLNPRAITGLLSFCYWWEAGRWYRGESAPIPECAPALPAVWTVSTVAGVVVSLLGDRSGENPQAAELLVLAAQAGAVSREAMVQVVGDGDEVDIAGGLFQLMLADLVADRVAGIREADALDLVRDHIRQRSYDTTGYSLSRLRADRISVGWLVRSPVPDGDLALDRAVFYVADDGVVERSTSSVPLSVFVTDFERRFRIRSSGRI